MNNAVLIAALKAALAVLEKGEDVTPPPRKQAKEQIDESVDVIPTKVKKDKEKEIFVFADVPNAPKAGLPEDLAGPGTSLPGINDLNDDELSLLVGLFDLDGYVAQNLDALMSTGVDKARWALLKGDPLPADKTFGDTEKLAGAIKAACEGTAWADVLLKLPATKGVWRALNEGNFPVGG